jgi:hypothetical protein
MVTHPLDPVHQKEPKVKRSVLVDKSVFDDYKELAVLITFDFVSENSNIILTEYYYKVLGNFVGSGLDEQIREIIQQSTNKPVDFTQCKQHK